MLLYAPLSGNYVSKPYSVQLEIKEFSLQIFVNPKMIIFKIEHFTWVLFSLQFILHLLDLLNWMKLKSKMNFRQGSGKNV